MKRAVHFIGSARPRSVQKFLSDLSDIEFLLRWLVQHDEKIDFVGYDSPAVETLDTAVRDIRDHWRDEGNSDLADLIDSVLGQADRERVLGQ